jgi:DNA-binding XRE family transcriptional regulator
MNVYKKIRETFGISQTELSKTALISRYRLSLAERGHCDLTSEEKLKLKKAFKKLREKRQRDLNFTAEF